MLAREVKITPSSNTKNMSKDAMDFVNRVLYS